MKKQDVIIIGAGIVGLFSAMKLLEKSSDLSVTILEKEGGYISDMALKPAHS